MPDELVDVVNEKDEIIGQAMKSKCHAEGLWHRISCNLIFNSEGKIWLQTRAKNINSGGKLDYSASGHVKRGDTYEQAAQREIQEELGISTELKLLFKPIPEIYNKINHMIALFTGKHDGPFKIQEEELEKVEAYSIEAIKKMNYQKKLQ